LITIWGNKFFPRIGDWYLGITGYKMQQLDEPEDPNKADNLWDPVPGDHGAHGAFDDRAQDRAIRLWIEIIIAGSTGRLKRRSGLPSWLAGSLTAMSFSCGERMLREARRFAFFLFWMASAATIPSFEDTIARTSWRSFGKHRNMKQDYQTVP
jgi:hypothetical protein